MEKKKAKILVVDDEPEIVETLKLFLSSKGHDVLGALSGEDALRILEKESADLILLDILMPGLKGTEVAKIIKEKYPSVKIIIVTGFPQEEEGLLQDNKLDGVFIKPVKFHELYNKLLDILNPEETIATTLETKQGIKARVLLIKAKLLFIDSSQEIYNFLNAHFKGLFKKGEDYEIDVAVNEETFLEKIASFKPQILAFNASFFKQPSVQLLSKICDKNLLPKEIIVYNIENLKNFDKTELERLTKAVETSCLQNGLIEIKWVEI